MSISSLIVQRELATIRQVEEALARQVVYGGDLVTNLLELVPIDESTLVRLAADSCGLHDAPPGPLPGPPGELRTRLPASFLDELSVFPFAVGDGAAQLAVAQKLARPDEERIVARLGMRVQQRIAPLVRIRQALHVTFGLPLDRRLSRLLQKLEGGPWAPRSSYPPASDSLIPTEARRQATARHERDRPLIPLAPAVPLPATLEVPVPTIPQRGAKSPIITVEAPGKPVSRRRGPYSRAEAEGDLEQATQRDELLATLFDYCKQYFDYSAFFVVQGQVAEGRDASGNGIGRDRIASMGVPLDQPGSFADARAKGAPRKSERASFVDQSVAEQLGREAGRAWVFPVMVRGRAVALFYGDPDRDLADDIQSEVASFVGAVGRSFERLIVRRKLSGFAPAGPDDKGGRPDVASIPPKHPSSIPVPTERAAESRPVSRPTLVQAPERAPDSAAPRERVSTPPPPQVVQVRRPSVPPIPREDAPYAVRDSVRPTLLTTGERPMDLGADALVARIMRAPDDDAESELLRMGDRAMPSLMARFPGPVTQSPGTLAPASTVGPILRLLVRMRRIAFPYVLSRIDDPAPDCRMWAMSIAAELGYPEAVALLMPRLFDESGDCQRTAFVGLASIARGHDRLVAENLRMLVAGPGRQRRMLAVKICGSLRSPAAVPMLLGLLDGGDRELSDEARRSLVLITGQDFETDTIDWKAWWGTFGSRHRIEWLIDALPHPILERRAFAALELAQLVPEVSALSRPESTDECDQALGRYRDYWFTLGRARFLERSP